MTGPLHFFARSLQSALLCIILTNPSFCRIEALQHAVARAAEVDNLVIFLESMKESMGQFAEDEWNGYDAAGFPVVCGALEQAFNAFCSRHMSYHPAQVSEHLPVIEKSSTHYVPSGGKSRGKTCHKQNGGDGNDGTNPSEGSQVRHRDSDRSSERKHIRCLGDGNTNPNEDRPEHRSGNHKLSNHSEATNKVIHVEENTAILKKSYHTEECSSPSTTAHAIDSPKTLREKMSSTKNGLRHRLKSKTFHCHRNKWSDRDHDRSRHAESSRSSHTRHRPQKGDGRNRSSNSSLHSLVCRSSRGERQERKRRLSQSPMTTSRSNDRHHRSGERHHRSDSSHSRRLQQVLRDRSRSHVSSECMMSGDVSPCRTATGDSIGQSASNDTHSVTSDCTLGSLDDVCTLVNVECDFNESTTTCDLDNEMEEGEVRSLAGSYEGTKTLCEDVNHHASGSADSEYLLSISDANSDGVADSELSGLCERHDHHESSLVCSPSVSTPSSPDQMNMAHFVDASCGVNSMTTPTAHLNDFSRDQPQSALAASCDPLRQITSHDPVLEEPSLHPLPQEASSNSPQQETSYDPVQHVSHYSSVQEVSRDQSSQRVSKNRLSNSSDSLSEVSLQESSPESSHDPVVLSQVVTQESVSSQKESCDSVSLITCDQPSLSDQCGVMCGVASGMSHSSKGQLHEEESHQSAEGFIQSYPKVAEQCHQSKISTKPEAELSIQSSLDLLLPELPVCAASHHEELHASHGSSLRHSALSEEHDAVSTHDLSTANARLLGKRSLSCTSYCSSVSPAISPASVAYRSGVVPPSNPNYGATNSDPHFDVWLKAWSSQGANSDPFNSYSMDSNYLNSFLAGIPSPRTRTSGARSEASLSTSEFGGPVFSSSVGLESYSPSTPGTPCCETPQPSGISGQPGMLETPYADATAMPKSPYSDTRATPTSNSPSTPCTAATCSDTHVTPMLNIPSVSCTGSPICPEISAPNSPGTDLNATPEPSFKDSETHQFPTFYSDSDVCVTPRSSSSCSKAHRPPVPCPDAHGTLNPCSEVQRTSNDLQGISHCCPSTPSALPCSNDHETAHHDHLCSSTPGPNTSGIPRTPREKETEHGAPEFGDQDEKPQDCGQVKNEALLTTRPQSNEVVEEVVEVIEECVGAWKELEEGEVTDSSEDEELPSALVCLDDLTNHLDMTVEWKEDCEAANRSCDKISVNGRRHSHEDRMGNSNHISHDNMHRHLGKESRHHRRISLYNEPTKSGRRHSLGGHHKSSRHHHHRSRSPYSRNHIHHHSRTPQLSSSSLRYHQNKTGKGWPRSRTKTEH